MSEIAVAPSDALFTLTTDQWTAPFWHAAAEGRLTAPRCADCGTFRMPPTPFCPACLSQALDWPSLSGMGTVFSYTVVRRALTPEMDSALPYVPALIDLEDAPGARLITNIIDTPVERIRVGGRVRVVWPDRPTLGTLPRFTQI